MTSRDTEGAKKKKINATGILGKPHAKREGKPPTKEDTKGRPRDGCCTSNSQTTYRTTKALTEIDQGAGEKAFTSNLNSEALKVSWGKIFREKEYEEEY